MKELVDNFPNAIDILSQTVGQVARLRSFKIGKAEPLQVDKNLHS